MSDPRTTDDRPRNPPDPSGTEQVMELEGRELRGQQDAALEEEQVETAPPVTDTEVYEGDLEAIGGLESGAGARVEDLADTELRDGETSDAGVAAEEGEAWVPPVDPPVVPGDQGDPRVAAGFGTTAEDEPFDLDHHAGLLPADDEVAARVREALLADARSSRLAAGVEVDVEGGRVRLRGVVDDLEDGDLLVAVASEVDGVRVVVDETGTGRP